MVDDRRGDTVPFPTIVWWWDERGDVDVPPAHAVCWVELVAGEERRAGICRVSKRTAQPQDPDDLAVQAELHHDLERRLGTPIRVAHATRHLGQLHVLRRLAVGGHHLTTLPLEDYEPTLAGGVAVRLVRERWRGEVVIRAGLAANLRDELLVWAERHLDQLPSATTDLEAWGWSSSSRGGWQQLLYSEDDSAGEF